MTGNEIGDKGAKAIIAVLKVNTTLTSLNLSGEEEGKKRERERISEKKNELQVMGLEMKEQNQ